MFFCFYCFISASLAEQCSAIFPDGLQNNNNGGDINFNWQAKLFNSPDNILETKHLIDGSGGVSCNTQACSQSNSIVPAKNYNDFPNNSNDINLGFFQSQTLSPGNYRNINVGVFATLTLLPGDYKISGDLKVSFVGNIKISGNGVVRFFVKKNVMFDFFSFFNTSGNAEQLLIFTNKDISIGSNARITGFLYSKKNVTLNSQGIVKGAITAKNITLISGAEVTFKTNEPDFGDFCGNNLSDLLALYQFEQPDLTNQIDDTSGYNQHGSNLGGLSLDLGKYCRGFDSNGRNEGSVTDNAFTSNLDLDNDVGLQGTISFWFKSNSDWDHGGYNGSGERTLFDASTTVSNKYFTLEIFANGLLRFSFEDSADGDFDIEEPLGTARLADTWYYVTVTWDFINNNYQIYVDGSLAVSQGQNTNGIMKDLGPVIFGDNSSTYGQNNHHDLASYTSANGQFDEVRIYKKVLSQTEIQTDMNDNHGCTPPVTLFQISHDGNGLTCSPEPVLIKACTNSGCTSFDNNLNTSVTLMVDNSPKSIAIVNGSSQNETFVYTDANTPVSLSLTSNYLCLNTTDNSNSCQLNFADTGFRFLANGQAANIPTQLSAKPSDTGFNAKTLSLQAISKNPDTGACETFLANTVDVEISVVCSSDINCANKNVAFTNDVTNAVTTITPSNSSAAPNYVPVSLDFGAALNYAAPFIVNYPDAGKMTLNARYNIPDENGLPSGNFMSGSSNSFVVRPLGVYVNVAPDVNGDTTNTEPTSATSPNSNFKMAGENFSTVITAVQWQSGDSDPSTGTPINNAVLKNNAPTVNFGQESTPTTMTLTHQLLMPIAGNNATLSATVFSNFTNGVSLLDMNYGEVGIIDFALNITNNGRYLGADDVIGTVPYVGRFTPAYFEQTIIDTTLNPSVVGGEGALVANHIDASTTCAMLDWVYSGQTTEVNGSPIGTIRYGIEPVLTITPFGVNRITLLNYIDDFAMLVTNLSSTTVKFDLPASIHANTLPLTGDVSALGTMIESSNGQIEYTLSDQHHFTYTRNNASNIAPFDAGFEIPVLSITDSDTIELRPPNNSIVYFENPTFDAGTNNTVNVRFGRWVLDSAFGPENTDIPMRNTIEQSTGNGFAVNSDENCITPAIVNKITSGVIYSGGLTLADYRLVDVDLTDGLSPADTNVSVSGITFLLGEYPDFIFSAPNNNLQGPLQIEYEVPSWLKYDWQNLDGNRDGPHTDNPSAIVTFGRYRGNDRIIYWREN